ncbi:hypothetical protein ACFVZM_16720 [Streptomyces sioyaensis]|uniref:hypothetical protein n=1 Tax=Streptomyces sioyaensis TaxID=67364 RepID=UPI0036CD681C
MRARQYVRKTGAPELHLKAEGAQLLPGMVPHPAGASPEVQEKSLAEVVESVNDEYGIGLSTIDQILLGQLVVAVSEDPELKRIGLHNDEETFRREADRDRTASSSTRPSRMMHSWCATTTNR